MARDLGHWLEELKLGHYAQAFSDNNIDQDLLLELNEADLERLGITSLGHRKRLLREIAALKFGLRTEDPTAGAAVPSESEGERRQLTVMFCDLVGSTALSGQLDPEDLREVLRRYQDAVAGAATRYGGYVARYVGDGVLIYFGWPQAYEDQAERAVWAGLYAAKAVEDIKFEGGLLLRTRVGIASGNVVIGDITGELSRDVASVTGETPNLAARLQEQAAAGEVIVDASTCGLVGGVFELEDRGCHQLKGFSEPVPVWHVLGEGQVQSRFEAARHGRLAPFVGRKHELGLVLERWSMSKSAEGQTVLLAGEAGIGKSRMVQVFCEEINDEEHYRYRLQCSSFHRSSAFYPIIQHLKRKAGFDDEDDNETRLDKLEALLRKSGNNIKANAPLLAALLSLSGETRYGPLDLTPQQQRDRTIDGLVNQVIKLSQQRPVLFILEDAQWIDPTTEDFIGEMIVRTADARVLLLITSRLDYMPSSPVQSNLATIYLNRLSKFQGAQILKAMAGDKLTSGVMAEVISRAEGVPLFVEELTNSMLESDFTEAEIPRSLQALLIARLDRLGEAKKIAQLAATLGRSFSHDFIRAVADVEEDELQSALGAMTKAGLLLQSGIAPQLFYTFKHALIQDAAYGTLLRSTRQQHHATVAEKLQQIFPSSATTEPEIIARHLSLAGLSEQAVRSWMLAGERAVEGSAYVEAIAHIEAALQQNEMTEDSEERLSMEITLREMLCVPLEARSWGSRDIEENLNRLHALREERGDREELFSVLHGLCGTHLIAGRISLAQQFAGKMGDLAEQTGEAAFAVLSQHAIGMTGFFAGELSRSVSCFTKTISLYEQVPKDEMRRYYVADPAIVAHCMLSWACLLLGKAAKAEKTIEQGLHLAEAVDHPFSKIYAFSIASSYYQTKGDAEAALRCASKAYEWSREHHHRYWEAWSQIVKGWALAATGEHGQGLEGLRAGLEKYSATGSQLILPYAKTLLVEALFFAGHYSEGLRAINDLEETQAEDEVRFYDPVVKQIVTRLQSVAVKELA